MIQKSGYNNRSQFLRDASLYFAEMQQRGELTTMADDTIIEGHLIVYFQHDVEHKLAGIRHSPDLEFTSYNHNCLKHSHSCVDVMQGIGTAAAFRRVMEQMQNTANIDKVTFVSAPIRQEGCC